MIARPDPVVQLIPIEQIDVVNVRLRGKSKFDEIVASITKLGLKRPITVARRPEKDGQPQYDLICGEGRLLACRAIGEKVVPAIVVEASKEDLLLMSLVENLARKRHTSIELAREIAALKERGYDYAEIARKTDRDVSYVRGIVRLLHKGEERLLQAVECGQIPISIAITIACSDDDTVQRALTEAYESKNLRGKALLRAKRLIETRRIRGKALRGGAAKGDGAALSADKLMKVYQQETNRQRHLVHKAKLCETRLLFIVSALKSVFGDENFVNLLRAEGLDTLPQYLADHLHKGKRS